MFLPVLKYFLGGLMFEHRHSLKEMGMLFALDGERGESADSYIPIVNEFFHVFLAKLSGLPPE